MCALSVRSLFLSCFRNYEQLSLDMGPSPVILTGHNGAGKTNILEAISFLMPGRGLRKATLSEVRRQKPDSVQAAWAVKATVHGPTGFTDIGTGMETVQGEDQPTERRAVKIDGKTVRGQTELARHCAIMWQTPQMDQLFQEGASAGRKFFDRLVYGFDPDHASRVNEYEQSMRERNRLLSDGFRPFDSQTDKWLSAIEKKMAEISVAIAFSRNNTVERLNNSIMMSDGTFPRALIDVRGWMEQTLFEGVSALVAEEQLAHKLRESRQRDSLYGRSSEGAHKAELRVHHLGKGVEASLCSTGEQKALLLSMILAQARARKKYHGAAPLLLLDEVVAHLDPIRREALFEEIEAMGAQAWMTGTDASLFSAMQNKAQFLTVQDGTVKRGEAGRERS